MQSWKGKTKGGLLGHKIFVFILQKLGLQSAYLLLVFVAAYYFLFARDASKSIYKYFREILNFKKSKALKSVYQSFFIFGQTLLDKIAVLAEVKQFDYTFDGEEHLKSLTDNEKGAILISAHLGNWEIAGSLFKGIDLPTNIVMFEAEHEKIKDYLEQVMKNKNINIIPIKEDMSHVFLINKALRNREVICMHGDRFVAGSRVLRKEFLGKKAYFPTGPFTIASKLQIPFAFVYAVKEGKNHYHLFSTPIYEPSKDHEYILNEYIQSLEEKVKKFPLQWFNYFDFWSENLKGGIVEKNKSA